MTDQSLTRVAQSPFRRQLLMAATALSFAAVLPHAASAAANPTSQQQAAAMQTVQFDNNGIKMAANVYFPPSFDRSKKYPAIVAVHPGGGVKEQTAGLYAQRLAAQGFVTIAFDASHQGASGGMPRFLDDPIKRVGDIYSAVD